MRWMALLLIVLASGTWLTSCGQGKDLAPNQPVSLSGDKRNPGSGEPRWPFWPQSMRIHPTTRLAADAETGEPIIELRLELRDAYNDVSKAVGVAFADLFNADASDNAPAVGHWEADLRVLPENDKHYDEVTQTYLLRLDLKGIPMPANARVRARFDSDDGRVFNDSIVLHKQRPSDAEGKK